MSQLISKILNFCNEWKKDKEDEELFRFTAYEISKSYDDASKAGKIEFWFNIGGLEKRFYEYIEPSVTKGEMFKLLDAFNRRWYG